MAAALRIALAEDDAFQRQIVTHPLARHRLRPIPLGFGAALKHLAEQGRRDRVPLDVQPGAAEAFDRAIDSRILRLRRRPEADPAKPEAIRSMRGVGYMLVPPKD